MRVESKCRLPESGEGRAAEFSFEGKWLTGF